MFTTLEVKHNLLQYIDVMILNAEKRPFNKVGWLYIGITLRSNENKVCVLRRYSQWRNY